jgi:trk system potassium uptake protein TrkH
MKRFLAKHFQQMNPAMIIIYAYLIADLLGTLLLSLEVSSTGEPVSMLDALFTSTSALCVTGLTVVDTGTAFSVFGQSVILTLMEIGGLGVMTFSVLFFLFLGRGFSTRGRWIINESFTATPVRSAASLLRSIFLFTFIVEAVGAALLTLEWRKEMPLPSAVYAGVFHSVSAFCNAGLALFETSFVKYRGSILVNVVICSLIVLGGIGFPVIHEFINRARRLRTHARTAMSLHTRTVLATTGVLILSGAALVFMLEQNHQIAELSLKEKILASLFQSITARTAGFNTLDIGSLAVATLFVLVILMFVGASPGSCGGGIKTTSIVVLIAILNDRIRGRHSASIFKRTLPDETVSKALSIFILAVITVTAGIVFLLVTQPVPLRESFLTYVFEAVSAFGTVGLSMGITPALTPIGKLIIITIMLLGRVGLLTVAYVVTSRRVVAPYRYAEEKIMIG